MTEQFISPEEMTLEEIEKYRAAARGELAIHTFSLKGSVQRELMGQPGEPLDDIVISAFSVGFGYEGEVQLTYDGAMAPERCTELADSLEAKLNR